MGLLDEAWLNEWGLVGLGAGGGIHSTAYTEARLSQIFFFRTLFIDKHIDVCEISA